MGDEATGIELMGSHQAQQGWSRVSVHQSGRDRDIASPQLLEMKRGRLAMDADIGNVPSRPNELGAQLEAGWNANGLDGDVNSEVTGQVVDEGNWVFSPVVDRR